MIQHVGMIDKRVGMRGFAFCIGVYLVQAAVAAADDDEDDDNDEIAFNLFTDVAPIVALFGEQFARQFMSESVTWLDHVIFAMVPIGIVTIITSAIRVQGPHIVRAFIGRARENNAFIEFELLSSTSREVGEAFNGKGIVRVLGRPKVNEFLIFPEAYRKAEEFFEGQSKLGRNESQLDKENSKTRQHPDSTILHEHESCGIHSLRSVIDPVDPRIMNYRLYRPLIHDLMRLFQWRKTNNDKDLEKVSHHAGTGMQDSLGCKWSHDKHKPDSPSLDNPDLGPPNMQLNLTSDHLNNHDTKRAEIWIVAISAVLIQAGLIILAAMTVFYTPLRKRISVDPQPFGFPCYAAGSTLLCVGIGICSYAVERNTIEVEWIAGEHVKRDDQLPRLVFLQQQHAVNDQYFDPYCIFGGRKRQIIGSARRLHSNAGSYANRNWEWITVAAAVAAGIGFTAQFMGLRGLTYPCSIAHLCALILMTALRGFIRRRLGHESAHCEMMPGYELEHLATLITFSSGFRSSDDLSRGGQGSNRPATPDEIFRWCVELPQCRGLGLKPERSATHASQPTYQNGFVENAEGSTNPRRYIPDLPDIKQASSEQLIRVRERLGNLCKWESRASKHALVLARSIEYFMETFCPTHDNLSPITWQVVAKGGDDQDQFTLAVSVDEHDGKKKWRTDVGRIDSVLSLWLACMEAEAGSLLGGLDQTKTKTAASKKQSNWLREEDSKQRTRFYRLLGESPVKTGLGPVSKYIPRSVLERDLRRWIGSRIALISRPVPSVGTRKYSHEPHRAKDNIEIPALVIGSPMKENAGPATAVAQNENIGGNQVRSEEFHELGVVSEGPLANILVQHLFTSFVWAIVKLLPDDCLTPGYNSGDEEIEIERRDDFDRDQFQETWHLPTLKHKKLTDTVQQLESYGLGGDIDVLLCIIPALSHMDLLPNHVILRLIPLNMPIEWISTARCYSNLMTSTSEMLKPERLSYAAIVHIMDFLELACRPYSGALPPPMELRLNIINIVKSLCEYPFQHMVKDIVALHVLQSRGSIFASIFRRYGQQSDNRQQLKNLIEIYEHGYNKAIHPYSKRAIGFSSGHEKMRKVLRALREGHNATVNDLHQLSYEELGDQDLFGWTPLHYLACSLAYLPKQALNATITNALARRCKVVDRVGRSHVHAAASRPFPDVLEIILNALGTDEKRLALSSSGKDGMTALHFAVQSRSLKCVELITKQDGEVQTSVTSDIWGRQPLHIAAQLGNSEIFRMILDSGKWSLTNDLMGKTPIEYILMVDDDADLHDHYATSESDRSRSHRRPQRVEKFGRLAMLLDCSRRRPEWKDSYGQGFLHHAARITDAATVRDMIKASPSIGESKDLLDYDGRAPLHHAIITDNSETAVFLIKEMKADPSLRHKDGRTPLMLAVQQALVDVARAILENGGNRDLALHYAIDELSQLSWVTDEDRLNIFKLFKEFEFDFALRDSQDRTVLQKALLQKNEPLVTYLLDFPKKELNRMFRDNESLLIEACKVGLTAAVPRILELWPESVHDEDLYIGQSPLSWACSEGHKTIVRMLVHHPRTNLRQQASTYRKDTPIHIAAERDDADILKLLLNADSSRYDLSLEDIHGLTPLQAALNTGYVKTTKELLKNSQTSDTDRIDNLELLLQPQEQKFHGIIAEIFGNIADKSLADDHFLNFIESAHNLGLWDAMERFVGRAMRTEAWRRLQRPYHVAVQAQNAELIAKAFKAGMPFYDDDGWSLHDYATSYGCGDLLKDQDTTFCSMREPKAKEMPRGLRPIRYDPGFQSSPCQQHGSLPCLGVQEMSVEGGLGYERIVFISTSHCVPPSSLASYFYFEIEFLSRSKSRTVGIGFCGENILGDTMPGCFPGSWAYHGGDRVLYVGTGEEAATRSPDLPEAEMYDVGDTVGVCWNSEASEALCTLNGKKLHIGNMQYLTSERLKKGKRYPCIGFDLTEEGFELKLRINFGGSPDHPFKYKGPYF